MTQNTHFYFNSEDGGSYLSIDRSDMASFDEWSNYIDGESTTINGYDAIVHRDHTGDLRSIEMGEGYLEVRFSHPVEQDDIYEPLIEDILASIEVD